MSPLLTRIISTNLGTESSHVPEKTVQPLLSQAEAQVAAVFCKRWILKFQPHGLESPDLMPVSNAQSPSGLPLLWEREMHLEVFNLLKSSTLM